MVCYNLVSCLLLTLVATVQSEIELDEGVLVLTQDNFDGAIEANPLILVEFYAPWCGHCKNLAPEYAKAAQTLAEANVPVKLAKVDATEHKELGQRYGVKGFPTLKFFRNGEATEYTGGRTADTIVSWLNKKSGPPAHTLDSVQAVEDMLANNKVFVLGCFKDAESAEAKAYLQVAADLDDQVFGISSAPEVFTKFEVTKDNAVILFKKFDEGKNIFEDDFDAASLKKFVGSNALPLVVDFNSDTAKMIFATEVKGHFMIFGAAKDEEHEHRLHEARKVAKDFKGEVLFVSVTTEEEEHKRVLDFFGIFETPTYRLCNVQEDFVKFKPETADFTEAAIRKFTEQFVAGELEPDLKSEEVPEDWNANPVKVLVGKNFAEVALDASKDVLVEFYAPWCGHCKKLAPIWDDLGEKFKDAEDVVIAKMDSTQNEVAGVKVRGFPTIKLFKKGDNSVVDYQGDRTMESFVSFIRPEQVPEEEEGEVEAEVKEEKKDEL